MSSNQPAGPLGPQLRLFMGGESLPDDTSLSPQITLTQLFYRWFLPICLEGENAADGTIEEYSTSMAYWAELTKDPPLVQISEFTIAEFKKALPKVQWRRGPLGSLRPLMPHTIAKHLKNVRAVLRRAGPTRDPDKPGKALLPEVPHIRVSKPRCLPKRPFELAIARQLGAQTARLPATDKMPAAVASRWWLALISVLYFTGVRIGTALKLEWWMVQSRVDGHWLSIPGSIIDKTHKPLEKFLTAEAFVALAALRTDQEKLMLPWPHCRRYLSTMHEDVLQGTLCGIAECDRLSFQAWRRMHGVEMARVGARLGIKIAAAALDHEDERTTRASYVDLEPELIRQLPPLIVPGEPSIVDRQQRLFD